MERILGPGMGDFVRALHEEHGVIFHLEDTVAGIDRGERPGDPVPAEESVGRPRRDAAQRSDPYGI